MPPPPQFRPLTCPACAQTGVPHGTLLLRTVQVNYKPGGGLVDESVGYWCPRCALPVSTQDMTTYQRVLDKQEELRLLQDELKGE